MNEIRERLAVHRQDALFLLQAVTGTATLYDGFRLAGAVGHLARAQVLLAEELISLPCGSKQATAGAAGEPGNEDETPVDGVRRD